jgi:hypothetical protein
MSNFDDDAVITRNAGDLIFNIMGVGTFFLLLLGFGLLAVCLGTTFCEPGPKVAVRAIYCLIYLIITLILFYSPRQEMFESSGFEPEVYDHSIIPRIAISLITCIFAILAGVFLVGHHLEPKELSTEDHEYNALWLED